jgi:hypothetical protein
MIIHLRLVLWSRIMEVYLHSPYLFMAWCLINITHGQYYFYLVSKLRSPQRFFPLGTPIKLYIYFSRTYELYMFCPLISLIVRIIWNAQIVKKLVVQFPSSVTCSLSLSDPNIILSTLLWSTLNLIFSLWVAGQFSHTHSTTRKVWFCMHIFYPLSFYIEWENTKYSELNGSKHSPNLVCFQLYSECNLD